MALLLLVSSANVGGLSLNAKKTISKTSASSSLTAEITTQNGLDDAEMKFYRRFSVFHEKTGREWQ